MMGGGGVVGEKEGLKPKKRDLRPIVRLQLQNKEGLKAVRGQITTRT